MRGTPNGSQDDLSGKRAPGAAPCPMETSQTCEPFAKGRNRAIPNSAGSLMARARSFNSPCPPMTNKRVCTGVNVRWVDGWAVSRLYADGVVLIGTGAKGSTCASHRGSAASFRGGSLQEFFLIVGVGFRKLGPRSLSATPEYVILAGICFPRSEACATFGLLAQELERVEPPSRAWCVRTVKLAL
jgi:hypothetical protein